MQNKIVILELDSLILLTGDTTASLNSHYTWLIHIQNDYCKPCWLQGIKKWDGFVKENKNTNAISIISVKGEELAEIRRIINKQKLKIQVYADCNNSFERNNSFIPEELIYHTFLFDSSNRIRLIGNPLRNEKIRNLFEKNFTR